MVTAHRNKCCSCHKTIKLISHSLPVCLDCIRNRFDSARPYIERAHASSRRDFDLPLKPPRDRAGVECNQCVNECHIPKGGRGFCGLRENREGELLQIAGDAVRGAVNWYHDPLPTNCVAGWVCPGGSECGYPDFSYAEGPEYGFENLAVFYQACTFNCLFCQNWHYRVTNPFHAASSAIDLVEAIRETTACICYFGGDPTPQLDHALVASSLAVEETTGRVLRICWETNGSMRWGLLKQMARLSLNTGGCIKFDLKAFDEGLNIALCGVSNRQTLENFRWLAEYSRQRPDPPLLVASTLLVPGYIDAEEVSRIAGFISSLDNTIPYTLLAFHPSFRMRDLPSTSRGHAEQALTAARKSGLKRVNIGNLHLLSEHY